jgi:hypothetical protein
VVLLVTKYSVRSSTNVLVIGLSAKMVSKREEERDEKCYERRTRG